MPEYVYLYALPYEIYKKYSLRKYGFHGTSHRYVSARAAELLGKPIEELKIISCHLGNGARHFRSVVSGHQYMHLACTLGRRCHGVACNRLQRVVVMFGNDQYCHVVSPE